MLLVLAHAIATTAFSNLVLKNPSLSFKGLKLRADLAEGPIQQRELHFLGQYFAFKQSGDAEVMRDPDTYADYLRANHVHHLRLLLPTLRPDLPFQAATGFMGGSQHYLAAKTQTGYAIWEVAEGGQVQGITYLQRAELLPPETDFSMNITAEHPQFAAVLTEIAALADRTGYDNFADVFRQALTSLSSPNAQGALLLVPEQYPLAARQLIDAAASAWVFGGMGSWNDLYIENDADYHEYERLSSALHTALYRAVSAAVNSL